MRTKSDLTKPQRQEKIISMLYENPYGYLQTEIARVFNVNRSTIGRDLAELPACVYADKAGRLKLDRERYTVPVELNRDEALALHLATRMLAARTDHCYPQAAEAMRKIGKAMAKNAPLISQHIQQTAKLFEDSSRKRYDNYIPNLETLTRAWANRPKVRIGYRKTPKARKTTFILAPLFIEPYPLGQTTYLIGRCDSQKLLTFKIEKIEDVAVLDEIYEVDAQFDPRLLLADAWSIWFTGANPIPVILHFSPEVAARVRATRWHPSQGFKDLPGGFLQWTAQIAEPTEMLPWIRGWGADVEVVEPEALRQRLVKEANALSELYRKSTLPGTGQV